MYSGVPVLWVSKMQTQIALSTIEAEYIALSHSMRDLIPVQEILKDIKRFMLMEEGYAQKCTTHSKAFKEVESGEDIIPPSLVYEDNEVLGLLRIPRSTPVPWIKDNAILALPDNVLTYVVLYTFS
jgi:hypothetical protein